MELARALSPVWAVWLWAVWLWAVFMSHNVNESATLHISLAHIHFDIVYTQTLTLHIHDTPFLSPLYAHSRVRTQHLTLSPYIIYLQRHTILVGY